MINKNHSDSYSLFIHEHIIVKNQNDFGASIFAKNNIIFLSIYSNYHISEEQTKKPLKI